MRVLIVEDEVGVAAFVRKGLREASCVVDWAADGIEGSRLAGSEQYDMILLDLMLPDIGGFEILQKLRSRGVHTPIICLTARDSVDDRVKGLNFGADDYVAKPFSFSELLARMNALLRRGQTLAKNPMVVADLSVNLLTRAVQRGATRIELSPREFALLEYMVRNVENILSRTMLLEHVWDMNQDPFTNVIDVHVNRLRKKIDYGFDNPLIHTIRGVGYVLRQGSPCDEREPSVLD